MTPAGVLRSVLAFVAAAALLVVPAGGTAFAAPTAPRQPNDVDAQTPEAGSSQAQPSQPDSTAAASPKNDGEPQFLALSIDSVAPTTVTSTSPPFLSVGATVRNVGDRDVTDVDVRIQRGPAIAQSSGLRTVLQLDQGSFDVTGDFVTVADRLGVGQSKQFTLTMPLRAAAATRPREPALDIDQPGVYPLLLNVNGSPEYGDPARLDDARFLLPVLGVPPVPNPRNPNDGRAIEAPTNAPIAMTMLWPLADRPRLAAGQPGSIDQPVHLSDDDLATSLAKGGRLDDLVSALETASAPTANEGGKLADSTCLAIDPDLLVTVTNMTRGYLVPQDPGNPAGPSKEGTGAAAATQWLDRVRALSAKMCTVALPFAQADLVAIESTHNDALQAAAVQSPADVVDTALGITSVRGVTWPDSGSIDDDTAAMLHQHGTQTVLVAGNAATRTDQPVVTPDVVQLADDGTDRPASNDALRAALFDVPSATAFAAVGENPQTPSFTPARARYDLRGDSRTARLQDALGALTWPTLTPPANHPRSVMFAPPQLWTADRNEAAALLAEAATLLQTGLATPRSFATLLAEPPDPAPFETNYLAQAVKDAVPDSTAGTIAAQASRIDWLANALIDDPQRPLRPTRFLAPLREDLLRAASLAGRRDSNRNNAQHDADGRLHATTTALDKIFEAVTVLAPGGVYTLASEQSPLLLVARNDLPVGIRVNIKIDAPDAMTITDIGEQQLPPSGSRTLQVPAKASDSINLAVDVSLTTPTGQPLGAPTTVSVRSNAYGPALSIVTGCAGALLLVLAGRRLWHRFRGQPDPADET